MFGTDERPLFAAADAFSRRPLSHASRSFMGMVLKGSKGSNPARAAGVGGLLRAARQWRFSVRSYMGRKTSRGDIVIGRPALSLKALPSTHDNDRSSIRR